MNKKFDIKILLIFFILLTGSLLVLSNLSKNKEVKVDSSSLAPFNEIISVPENYRILDFDNWTEGMTRYSLYKIENSDICVTQEDVSIVEEITDILNRKTFIPIIKEEFDTNYNDSNDKVKFWLSTSAEVEASRENFYPYNIFIYEDLSLYVEAIKASDSRYLKSTLTEDEYKLIEDSYNTLFKEK